MIVSDEGQMRAAIIIRDAAAEMTRAADRMESASHRIGLLLEDGYGGNGLRLIELLDQAQSEKQNEPDA